MKSFAIIITISVLAYLILLAVAYVFWFVYPYPESPSQEEINFVWNIHILAEKLFSYLLTILISI